MASTITLKHKITLQDAQPGAKAQQWTALSLRDIEAGDIVDAGRALPDGASQTEMQLRVAAICADLPFAILRKLKPADMVQVERWWQQQWSSVEPKQGDDDEAGQNPLPAAAVTAPRS